MWFCEQTASRHVQKVRLSPAKRKKSKRQGGLHRSVHSQCHVGPPPHPWQQQSPTDHNGAATTVLLQQPEALGLHSRSSNVIRCGCLNVCFSSFLCSSQWHMSHRSLFTRRECLVCLDSELSVVLTQELDLVLWFQKTCWIVLSKVIRTY